MRDFYIEQVAGVLIVYVRKEVDHHLARQIRQQVDLLIDQGGVRHLVMDFHGVNFMDSSGIGMIMGRYKKLKFFGGKLTVSGVNPEVERIFSMSGLYTLVPKYKDVEAAIANIQK